MDEQMIELAERCEAATDEDGRQWNGIELAAARDSLAAAVRVIAEDSDYSNELVGIAVRNWFHRRRSSPHPKGTDQ